MSDIVGPISVDGRSQGMLLPGTSDVSEHTQQLIDQEVRRIVEDAERDTVTLIGNERHRLEALAQALLERETLDQPDAYEIAGVPLPAAVAAAEASAETASA